MTLRSRFDELHDRFDSFRTTKPGTRYERLAAMVLKALDARSTVVHDIRLAGTSEVKHQIDVTVSGPGGRRRILVECKDFDLSRDPVGLGTLRNFFGVIEDTKPDEALVVTCGAFTEDARTYARAKGIRLAILRRPHENDWRRGPRAFHATIHLTIPELVDFTLNFIGTDRSILDRWVSDRLAAGLDPRTTNAGDPVFINGTEDGRAQFNDYVSKHMNLNRPQGDEVREVTVPLQGMTAEVEDRGGLPLDSMILRIRLRRSEGLEIHVAADTIAALILEAPGQNESVIWEHDLRRFVVGTDGVVRDREGGASQGMATDGGDDLAEPSEPR